VVWRRVEIQALTDIHQSRPVSEYLQERWFAEPSSGKSLRLAAYLLFQNDRDQKWLSINLFQIDGHDYYYNIPYLITLEPQSVETGFFFTKDRFFFYDGFPTREFISLLRQLPGEECCRGADGRFEFVAEAGFGVPRTHLYGNSSNSLLLVTERYLVKNYRRVYPGINPELEIGRELTKLGSAGTPAVLGHYRYRTKNEKLFTLGVFQEFIDNQGTGWEVWGRLLEKRALGTDLAEEAFDLGGTIARLHRDLALISRKRGRLAGLKPEDLGERFGSLEKKLEITTVVPADLAGSIRARLAKLKADLRGGCLGAIFIIHGDLHLEQVLKTEAGWVIIDFEGEPLKNIKSRGNYDSPLKDLASLLRSISYRLHFSGQAREMEAFLCRNLVDGYLEVYRFFHGDYLPTAEVIRQLLFFFQFERVVYELEYEIRYRPKWVNVPLNGIRNLLES